MSDPAKVKEPSMDDILSSIRQIIADEDETDMPEAVQQAAEEPAIEVDAEAAADQLLEDEAQKAELGEEAMGVEPAAVAEPVIEDEAIGDVAEVAEDEVLELSPDDMVVEDSDLDEEPGIVEPADIGFDDLEPVEEVAEEVAEPEPEIEIEEETEVEMELEEAVSEPVEDNSIEEVAGEEVAAQGIVSSTTDTVVRSALTDLSNLVMSEKTRTLEDLVQEMLRPMMKAWLDENLPNMVEELVREEIQRISRKK